MSNTKLILQCVGLLIALVVVIVCIVILLKRIQSPKMKDEETDGDVLFNANSKENERQLFKKRDIRDALSMDGVDPNPLSYMVINDCGRDCYVRNFFIHTMPKRVQFATSFAPLFDYENCVASVFMFPVPESKSIRQLDNRIVKIESEWTQAVKDGDRNRQRKMKDKMRRTEMWAQNIESGEDSLYEVGFLFTIFADSLENLNLESQKFVLTGRNKGMELCSCYGVHPEAFLSNAPFNHIYSLSLDSFNIIKSTGIKMQVMDKYSLATVFHHTNSSFTHKNGIPAGRNMHTGEPTLYDPYDKSHNGYNVLFTGMTGTGKSAAMKMFIARLKHKHFRFVSIDFEKKGGRGEFSNIAEMLSGVSFQIKNDSKYRINPFDIKPQLEWDEPTDTEFLTLRLSDKISNLVHIIMTMICGEDEQIEFNMNKSINAILRNAITKLYSDRGIVDGKPDSVYELGRVLENGVMTDGLVEKQMPTFSDLYLMIAKLRTEDKEDAHTTAYTVILDAIGDCVKHVIYNRETAKRYTPEEYEELKKVDSKELENIIEVRGTKYYFDGQSTIEFTEDTPYINIDISDLPKDDKPIAQEFACDFVEENFMKKNSENPRKAKKCVVICDEAHNMFPYKDARMYLSNWYRTARKRHISVWTCTQALKDCDGYPETEAIITNATSIFLFKQAYQHASYLKEKTILTDSQISKVLQIGGDPNEEDGEHKGECCLIDNNQVVFLKIDYLPSERYIVETNISKIKEMYSKTA